MLSLLSFDDDSLPNTRRAVMTTASTLILTSYLGLKLDFSAVDFAKTSTDGIEAVFILLPLMVYLVWRLIAVSSWYLPITHSEMIRSDPKIVRLIERLNDFSATAHDSKELGLALGKLQTAEYTKHVELSRKIDGRLMELNDQTNRWMNIFMHVPSTDHRTSEQNAELSEIDLKWGKLNQEIHELQDHLSKFRSAIHQIHMVSHAEDAGIYADKIRDVSGDLAGLINSIEKNALGTKFQGVLSAIDEIDVDFGNAVQKKKRDIRWSGKWFPLLWSFVAISFSVYNLS